MVEQTSLFGSPTFTRNSAICSLWSLDQSNANPLRLMFHTNCSVPCLSWNDVEVDLYCLFWQCWIIFLICQGWMGLSTSVRNRGKNLDVSSLWFWSLYWVLPAPNKPLLQSQVDDVQLSVDMLDTDRRGLATNELLTWEVRRQTIDGKAEKYRWSLNTFEEVTCPSNI